MLINDVPMQAIIDTGSDITIMRADEFIRIGSPNLTSKSIIFRGIGKEQNNTLGEFGANLTIDGNSYAISINVVSDELSKHCLLIDNDFLDTVELNVKLCNAIINPANKDDSVFAEICHISVDEIKPGAVDISHVPNNEHAKEI